jgi:hypothetical protein
MLRTTLIVISATAAAVLVNGCGLVVANDGPHTVQTRTVGTVDRVENRGSANLVVTRGTSATLTGASRAVQTLTR